MARLRSYGPTGMAAFLGYNPIAELLGPSGALQQPVGRVAARV